MNISIFSILDYRESSSFIFNSLGRNEVFSRTTYPWSDACEEQKVFGEASRSICNKVGFLLGSGIRHPYDYNGGLTAKDSVPLAIYSFGCSLNLCEQEGEILGLRAMI